MKLDGRNSLAARRNFIGDFTLPPTSAAASLLTSSSEQRLNAGLCDRRRHHRPADVFPAHILPHLYLGNNDTAKNRKMLNRCGIRHVINVTSNLPNYFENEPDFHYLRIPVDDSSSQNLFQFFPEAIAFIERAHAEGCSVLVHCWAGISRSVTVCLAYLMYVMNSPLEEAFDLLLKLNGAIAPNFHFLETLTCWERLLLGGRPKVGDLSALGSDASSLPSSSTASIASSEVSPISRDFESGVFAGRASSGRHHLSANSHMPCFKTASSPTIAMNLPSSSSHYSPLQLVSPSKLNSTDGENEKMDETTESTKNPTKESS